MRPIQKLSTAAGADLETTPSSQVLRRLAFSRGVTFAGGGAAFWALAAVLYADTHSATWVAGAALASFSVPALLSPAAGSLGDRFDRRHVMALSEIAGAFCFGLMTVFTAPAALLSLRFLASVAAAPLVPATSAALPSLVSRDNLERANGTLSKAGTAGALIGPAIAAIVLTTVGGRWVFLINAMTFIVSAGLILSIRRCARVQPLGPSKSLLAGFSFLRRDPVLRSVSLAYGIAFVGIGVCVPSEVALVAMFGQRSIGYATLVCSWGLGMLAGATVGQRLGVRPKQVFVIGTAASALTAGCLGVAVAPLFAIALLSMALGGWGAGLWEVSQNCLIQRATPNGIRTRVFAANEALMQGGIALGLMFSGLPIAIAGAKGGFVTAAAMSGLGALMLFRRGSRSELSASQSQQSSGANQLAGQGPGSAWAEGATPFHEPGVPPVWVHSPVRVNGTVTTA